MPDSVSLLITRCSCGQNISQYQYFIESEIKKNSTSFKDGSDLVPLLDKMKIIKMCCRTRLLTRSLYFIADEPKHAYVDISGSMIESKRGCIVIPKDTLKFSTRI